MSSIKDGDDKSGPRPMSSAEVKPVTRQFLASQPDGGSAWQGRLPGFFQNNDGSYEFSDTIGAGSLALNNSYTVNYSGFDYTPVWVPSTTTSSFQPNADGIATLVVTGVQGHWEYYDTQTNSKLSDPNDYSFQSGSGTTAVGLTHAASEYNLFSNEDNRARPLLAQVSARVDAILASMQQADPNLQIQGFGGVITALALVTIASNYTLLATSTPNVDGSPLMNGYGGSVNYDSDTGGGTTRMDVDSLAGWSASTSRLDFIILHEISHLSFQGQMDHNTLFDQWQNSQDPNKGSAFDATAPLFQQQERNANQAALNIAIALGLHNGSEDGFVAPPWGYPGNPKGPKGT